MKYLSPIAYFKAFEKKLPDGVDFERMISSTSFEESMTVLQDTHYAEFVSQDSNLTLEEILEKEDLSFREDLKKLGFSQKVIEFLFLKEDLFNLSLELKKEILGIDTTEKLYGSGLSIDDLKEKYSSLVEEIKEDSLNIDEKVFQFYFEEAKRQAKKLKSKQIEKFFSEYVKKKDEKELEKLEKRFLEENKWRINGLDGVFSFFLKRRKAEKKLKTILSSKQINLEVEKINKLTRNLPALV